MIHYISFRSGMPNETMKRNKISLLDLNPDDLKTWCGQVGEPPFRAGQILSWIYGRGVLDFEKMTDLSKSLRRRLDAAFVLPDARLDRRQDSADGSFKLGLRLADEGYAEAVYLPAEDHYTLCISSQTGCALGCRFCATGAAGGGRNLTTGEILSQVFEIQRIAGRDGHANLVFMGMGEPLLNSAAVLAAVNAVTASWGFGWSPRRITLSTAGIIPEIQRLGDLAPGINLAVSLNAPDDRTRSRLMPINRKYPLKTLLQTLREYPLYSRQQAVTIEYIMLRNLNDSDDAARKLTRILDPGRFKINLIAFNPFPGCRFRPSEPERILAFQEILGGAGFIARIRKNQGGDIAAACGQLAGCPDREGG